MLILFRPAGIRPNATSPDGASLLGKQKVIAERLTSVAASGLTMSASARTPETLNQASVSGSMAAFGLSQHGGGLTCGSQGSVNPASAAGAAKMAASWSEV
jgi:hypothetical protein